MTRNVHEFIIETNIPRLTDNKNPVIPPAAILLILSSCLRKAISEHSEIENKRPKLAKAQAELGAFCLIDGTILSQLRLEIPRHVIIAVE